ncbi:MAG: TonB-dependent receptor [Bacteroidetes bacterium]|nr:TonB-dependent receptor [Bacteroidota bacterium]
MKQLISIFIFLNGLHAYAQCDLVLSGKVISAADHEVLSFSTIYIKELKTGATANEKGVFTIDKICPGKYTVEISQLGHTTLDTLIEINKNAFCTFNLPVNATELKVTTVEALAIKKQEIQTLQKEEISGVEMDKTRGLSLGESLKSITGVNSIQTGPSISKPMIHGMYGNRILIMNNGVRLESQTWGSDHAPEIDPFIATKFSVIKGAASIRYGTNAIAGVVLVEPKEMPATKCLNGEVNLVGTSNGRSGTASGFLEGAFDKKLSGLSWRVQGTIKEGGNYSTPTYYLKNTATKENNYSAALSYNKKNFGVDLFYSRFNTMLGIYTGSHIGNLNDLYLAFNSPEPIVKSEFSYKIERGYQTVDHQLIKAKAFYNFKNAGKLEYTFARQENKRAEYGEDLSYNQSIVDQNIPDAYFQLITHTSELVWEHKPVKHITGSIGASYITQGNVFRGLDYRALIPNYRTYGGGLFILEKWNKRKLTIEAGARYDYEWMRTYLLDFTTLKSRSDDYSWENYSGTVGAIYQFNKNLSLNVSGGIGWRPPAPIELFALGIHQSAASFEIGDTSLRAERSYNSQAYLNYTGNKFSFEIGGYFNVIDNFIYLKPLPDPVTTIGGVFPAYKYTQANVYYSGLDANLSLKLTKNISLTSKTTIVYAYNRSQHEYLIYVPANRFDNGISFSKDSIWKFKQAYLNFSVLTVATQNHVPPHSDYVPPPKGYTLLNAAIGFSIPVKQQLISVSLGVTNIMNVVYRDYLNRFRYYTNDLGRNFTVRLKIPFSVFHTEKKDE